MKLLTNASNVRQEAFTRLVQRHGITIGCDETVAGRYAILEVSRKGEDHPWWITTDDWESYLYNRTRPSERWVPDMLFDLDSGQDYALERKVVYLPDLPVRSPAEQGPDLKDQAIAQRDAALQKLGYSSVEAVTREFERKRFQL